MARRKRRGRTGAGKMSAGAPGAAAAARKNQSASTVARVGSARRGRTSSSDTDAANRVGGVTGMSNFDVLG